MGMIASLRTCESQMAAILVASAAPRAFDFDTSKPTYGTDIFLVCLLTFVFVGGLAGLVLVDLRRKWRGDSFESAATASAYAPVSAAVAKAIPKPAGSCRAGWSLSKTSTTDALPTIGLPKMEGISYSPTQTPSRPSLQQGSTEFEVDVSDGGEVSSGSTTEVASSVYEKSAGRKNSGLKSLQTPGYRVESMVEMAFW
ncbi:hypothetical protein MCOR15_003266 [Pyricularia oryzae]|nr:hypothetical protein MCOR15_003266 [Pyricularia oryzae]